MEDTLVSEILFTRAEGCGSKLIRKVTGEDISHVALRIGAFVIHSRMIDRGLVIDLYSDFIRDTEIVYRIPWIVSTKSLSGKKYKGIGYDIGAILYLGIRIIGHNILRIPMPKKNLWQTTGMYMCTEFITDVIDQGREDSMITPYGLYKKLYASKLN